MPIIDGLVNNNEGYFQVNVPNHGALPGIPDDVVVEVPAIVNQKGIQPVRVPKLPAKIMIERIYPDWLEMERELLAFKTGDQAAMLYGVLDHHQTKSYDQAVEHAGRDDEPAGGQGDRGLGEDEADQRRDEVSDEAVEGRRGSPRRHETTKSTKTIPYPS